MSIKTRDILNMLAPRADLLMNTVIPIAADGFSILWKKTKVSTTIFLKYFGLPGLDANY
jgi:hypothetical protein